MAKIFFKDLNFIKKFHKSHNNIINRAGEKIINKIIYILKINLVFLEIIFFFQVLLIKKLETVSFTIVANEKILKLKLLRFFNLKKNHHMIIFLTN